MTIGWYMIVRFDLLDFGIQIPISQLFFILYLVHNFEPPKNSLKKKIVEEEEKKTIKIKFVERKNMKGRGNLKKKKIKNGNYFFYFVTWL